MDFDSSAKFISSLAKFLQSLCNGYVEFDNGVEVIGHIYLNVDTGKKIDYVLNEKVCKTDENSVTFISNSFHAQPAEKPKPIEKPKQKITTEIEQETDNEIILMEDSDKSYEQYGDNVQHNSSPHPKPPRSHGASKRSYSQSFASNRSSKAVKFDSTSSSNPNGAHLPSPSNNSTNDSSFNVSGNITAASESDLSHLSQVFPETVDPSNAQDRDIKPILDKDLNVINVKQEYDPSAEGQGDGGTYDDQGDGSYYSQDQMYESGNEYYGSGHRNSTQRSDYDPSKLYLGEAGTSGSTGDAPEGAQLSHLQRFDTNKKSLEDFHFQQSAQRPFVSSSHWCCYCNEEFISEQLLTKHLVEQACRKPYKCEKCALSFMHRSTLRRHQTVCGGKFRLKLHNCSLCNRNFTYRHDLRRHIRNIHNDIAASGSCL